MATLALDEEYVDDMQRRQWDDDTAAESLVLDSLLEVGKRDAPCTVLTCINIAIKISIQES